MNSKRLQFIASIIDSKAKVIDIGTDHAYLPIILKKTKNITKVIGCDVHENTLINAYRNLEENNLINDIKLIKSDGLHNIDTTDYDTLVLAGMGAYTIMHILEEKEKLLPIKDIYMQPNKDYEIIRNYMYQNNWTLQNEYLIQDKKHLYHIMKYTKGKEQLKEAEINFGKYNKDYTWYYKNLYTKYQKIYNKLPKDCQSKKDFLEKKLKLLDSYLQTK